MEGGSHGGGNRMMAKTEEWTNRFIAAQHSRDTAQHERTDVNKQGKIKSKNILTNRRTQHHMNKTAETCRAERVQTKNKSNFLTTDLRQHSSSNETTEHKTGAGGGTYENSQDWQYKMCE